MAPAFASAESSRLAAAASKRWLALAIGSLLASGVLALFLVVGRAPGLHTLFTDPLLFKRCLVVHVDLALVVWLHAFIVALFFRVPSSSEPTLAARASPYVAAAGVGLLGIAAAVPGAEPILANYVPVIDQPFFVAGLVIFGLGVMLAVMDRRIIPDHALPAPGTLPASSAAGIRAAAVAMLVAETTFGAAATTTPPGLQPKDYWELVAWGGGHILQFAMVTAMLAIWLALVEGATGRPVMSARAAALLFALHVAPTFAGPLLAFNGTTVHPYYGAFTQMMRWGIWPVPLVMLSASLTTLMRARRLGSLTSWRDPRAAAFGASALLTVAGFLLGASIRGSDTRVPAHYHASIGAVTAACMAMTWPLLHSVGAVLRNHRGMNAMRWQPLVFGLGQLTFALGFALAGAAGMGRKAYASEQHVRTWVESLGLGVMALGGLVAVGAGAFFLYGVLRAWLHGPIAAPETAQGDFAWNQSIPSRG
ncbi:MAG: cbb3-type cytochrome c oxidase subunit I [Myxococcota bacterium]